MNDWKNILKETSMYHVMEKRGHSTIFRFMLLKKLLVGGHNKNSFYGYQENLFVSQTQIYGTQLVQACKCSNT